MAELTSPFSAKPSSLKDPVPGQEAQSELDAFLAELDAPKVQAAPSQAPGQPAAVDSSGGELDQFLAQQGGAPAQDGLAPMEPASTAPDPRGIESMKEQAREFTTPLGSLKM